MPFFFAFLGDVSPASAQPESPASTPDFRSENGGSEFSTEFGAQSRVQPSPVGSPTQDQQSPLSGSPGPSAQSDLVDSGSGGHPAGQSQSSTTTANDDFPIVRPVGASSRTDYGKAVYILTRRMNATLLVYRSRTDEGRFYLFRKASGGKHLRDGTIADYYRCQKCEGCGGGTIARTVVHRSNKDDDGRITSDPDVGHSRLCVPLTEVDIEGIRMKREMALSCQQGQRPLQAYQATMEEAAILTSTVEEEVSLANKIGSYRANRSTLYK